MVLLREPVARRGIGAILERRATRARFRGPIQTKSPARLAGARLELLMGRNQEASK
jgi:hypothetical protein